MRDLAGGTDRLPARAMAIYLAFLLALCATSARAADWAPVVFGPASKPIRLESDDRLTPQSVGAVEIMVHLDEQSLQDLPERMTVFAFEDITRTHFRLDIVDKGRQLELRNANGAARVELDMTVPGYYQLAVSTVGGVSRIFDGEDLLGEVRIGYGPVERLPLQIGGGARGDTPLIGEVHYIRIWDKPLDPQTLALTLSEYGFPDDEPDLAPFVRLYSEFTDESASAFYTEALTLDDVSSLRQPIGVQRGEPVVSLLPKDGRISKIVGIGGDRLHALTFVTEDRFGERSGAARHGAQPATGTQTLTSFELADGETIAEVRALVSSKVVMVQEDANSISATNVAALEYLTFTTSEGRVSPRFGNADFDPATAGGVSFQSIGMATQPRPGANGTTLRAFELDAVVVWSDDDGVHALDFTPRVFPPELNPDGLWEPKAQNDAPILVSDETVLSRGGRLPHGNYMSRSVMRLRMEDRGRTIRIGYGNITDRLRLQPDGTYADATGGILRFVSETEMMLGNTPWKKVLPRPDLRSKQDFIALGGVFAQEGAAPVLDYSFHGYNISDVDPRDIIRNRGQRNLVFARPGPKSVDYYTRFQKIVPQGLLIALASRSGSTTTTVTTGSASEFSEAHASSLGISTGIDKAFSFGVDSQVTKDAKSNGETGSQIVLAESFQSDYALVSDWRRQSLDPDFQQTLLSILMRRKRGETVDYQTEVIDIYGTHYAHAVTSGQSSRNSLIYSKEAAGGLMENGSSVDVHASATVKGWTNSGKYTDSENLSVSANASLERQVESFTEIGSASIPAPIFLDLRPLSDLVDVVFFEDAVFGADQRALPVQQVQRELSAAITGAVAAAAPRYDDPADIWEPYVHRLSIDEVVFDLTSPDLSDLDAAAVTVGFDDWGRRTPVTIYASSRAYPTILVPDDLSTMLHPPKQMKLPLLVAPKTQIITAAEFCTASNLGGSESSFVGFLKMTKVFRGLFKNSLMTDDSIDERRLVPLEQLGPTHTTFKWPFKVTDEIKGTWSVTGWQMPGNGGAFRPLPVCPKT